MNLSEIKDKNGQKRNFLDRKIKAFSKKFPKIFVALIAVANLCNFGILIYGYYNLYLLIF